MWYNELKENVAIIIQYEKQIWGRHTRDLLCETYLYDCEVTRSHRVGCEGGQTPSTWLGLSPQLNFR